MNARKLEVFRAVMRNGSLTAAAQALNVSQPAVSKTLRHFEDQIGYPLFDRIGGRLRATPEAHLLYEDADRVFREIEAVRDLALRIKEHRIGLLRIGASPPPTFSVLPRALAAFRTRHPQVKVVLNTYGSAEMGDKLTVGDLDLALIMSALPTVAVRHEALSTVPIVVVVPTHSHLADLVSIGPEDLRDETLISYGPHAETTTSLDAAFEAAGCVRRVAIEVASSVAALPMVFIGARGGDRGRPATLGTVRWAGRAPLSACVDHDASLADRQRTAAVETCAGIGRRSQGRCSLEQRRHRGCLTADPID